MTRVVAVVGPTAAGKSAVAVEIALAIGGEVVNADSRLFCRGFDIGTAKPTPAEQKGVPHHLINILESGESLGLRAYLDRANGAIEAVIGRGRVPVVVGGTGQYVWGLLEGWRVARVPPDPAFRASLEREAAERGFEAVASRLRNVDPEAAARIDPRNIRRVIRALEVARGRGEGTEGPGRPGKAERPPYDSYLIGLTMPRPDLYRRVDERIDRMVESGWLDEVKRLLDAGVALEAPCMQSIGYSDMARVAIGQMPLREAVKAAQHDTRRLVRHQYSWFRLGDPRIHWISSGSAASDQAIDAIRKWLATPPLDKS